MDNELESLAEGKKILIDSSFLSTSGSSYVARLYESKWNFLPISCFQSAINNVETIETLLRNGHDVFAIPETKKEMEELLRLLNKFSSYFNYSPDRHRGNKKFEKKSIKREGWKKENEESFNAHLAFAERIFRLKNSIPISSLPVQDSNYAGIAKLVREFNNEDIRWRDSHGVKSEREFFKNPVNIGEKLETDHKIITASLILARDYPVLILTRDKGIFRVISRFYSLAKGKNNGNSLI